MDIADNSRYEQLYKQIIEIASGNFEYRNVVTDKRDKLDTLAELLNMMTEEIAYFDYEKKSSNEYIIIDQNYVIQSFTRNIYKLIGHKKTKIHKSLRDILDPNSFNVLEKQIAKSLKHKKATTPFLLNFQSPDKYSSSLQASLKILKNQHSQKSYLLSIWDDRANETTVTGDRILSTDYKSLKNKSTSNRILTRRVKLYILRNLDKTLPSLKEIGLIHHTNQTKLKEEFKKAFGTTIYRFHNSKRLEQAALLLKTTEIAIGDIAHKCGFKDPAHFTKKFKEVYSITPRQFRLKHS